MDVTGRICYVGPIKSAPRADGRGEYRWREFVVEYEGGQYPKRVLFEAPADSLVESLEVGREVSVRYDSTVRRYTSKDGRERLFNRLTVWHNGIAYVGYGPQAAQPAAKKGGDPALEMFD